MFELLKKEVKYEQLVLNERMCIDLCLNNPTYHSDIINARVCDFFVSLSVCL